MHIITPPHPIEIPVDTPPVVFLAGSIEMGKAIHWQAEIIRQLQENDWQGIVLNPRRQDWDSSWEQKKENGLFNEQVNWELEGLEKATCTLFYFAPGTKSPITLLELGLQARAGKALVCCPDGFWRKGNIDIVCERYDVPQVATLEELVSETISLS